MNHFNDFEFRFFFVRVTRLEPQPTCHHLRRLWGFNTHADVPLSTVKHWWRTSFSYWLHLVCCRVTFVSVNPTFLFLNSFQNRNTLISPLLISHLWDICANSHRFQQPRVVKTNWNGQAYNIGHLKLYKCLAAYPLLKSQQCDLHKQKWEGKWSNPLAALHLPPSPALMCVSGAKCNNRFWAQTP